MLLATCLLGLLLVVLGWPGTFVIAGAAAVYGVVTGFESVAASHVAWLFGLAIAGELIETVAAGLGIADRKPSKFLTGATLSCAFVGAIVGTPFLFGVGSLLGSLAGAFLGATIAVSYEGADLSTSLATGLSALRGRLLGFLVKSVLTVSMIVVVLSALW
jgi:hypothetical protein